MVVYGGVCVWWCVYGGVWWCMVVCVWWCAIDNPSGRAVRTSTAAHRDSSGSAIPCVLYGAWCGLYLKVVYEFRVDVFLLRHVLTFFIEYDVVLKERTFNRNRVMNFFARTDHLFLLRLHDQTLWSVYNYIISFPF
jgi:hypothetical protein